MEELQRVYKFDNEGHLKITEPTPPDPVKDILGAAVILVIAVTLIVYIARAGL